MDFVTSMLSPNNSNSTSDNILNALRMIYNAITGLQEYPVVQIHISKKSAR